MWECMTMSHRLYFSPTLGEPERKSRVIGGGGSGGETGLCLELSVGFAGTRVGFTHGVPQATPPKRNPLPKICMSVHECLQVLVCSRLHTCVITPTMN